VFVFVHRGRIRRKAVEVVGRSAVLVFVAGIKTVDVMQRIRAKGR